jgi:hypothetical protein
MEDAINLEIRERHRDFQGADGDVRGDCQGQHPFDCGQRRQRRRRGGGGGNILGTIGNLIGKLIPKSAGGEAAVTAPGVEPQLSGIPAIPPLPYTPMEPAAPSGGATIETVGGEPLTTPSGEPVGSNALPAAVPAAASLAAAAAPAPAAASLLRNCPSEPLSQLPPPPGTAPAAEPEPARTGACRAVCGPWRATGSWGRGRCCAGLCAVLCGSRCQFSRGLRIRLRRFACGN